MKKTYSKTFETKEAMKKYFIKLHNDSRIETLTCGRSWNGTCWENKVSWCYK